MNTIHRSLLLVAAGSLISLGVTGCYTRIATVEDRSPEYTHEEEEYVAEEGEVEDSTYEDRGRYWDDELRWRYNMGFRYYYPWHMSSHFGYYDPWYYDHIYYPWSFYDSWNWYYSPYAYRYSIYGPYSPYYSRYAGYYGLGYYPYAQPVIYYGLGEGSGFSTRNSGYSRTGDVRSNPRSPGTSSSGADLPPATRAGMSRDSGPARSSGSTGVERRGASGSSRESSVGRSSRGSSGREGVSSGRSSGSSGRSSGSGSGSRGGGNSSGSSGGNRSSGGSRGGGGDSPGSSSIQHSYSPPPSAQSPSASPAPASSGENSRRSGATREN